MQDLDRPYLKKIEDIEFQPVFIMGLHRSGTSILYKMLVETGRFNSVTAYHIIKYNELLYNKINKKEDAVKEELTNLLKKQFDRGIDKLKINADFAEEFGFLLGKYTYEMYISDRNRMLFTELAKKIQFTSGNNKPILFKNPYDLPNFLYIKKIYPNAKFVFIHRHPIPLLSSSIKAIRFILKEKNLYTTQLSPLYDKVFQKPFILFNARLIVTSLSPIGMILLTARSAKGTKYYLKNIDKLPKEDYVDVTYEKLCEHPQETIKEVMDSLGERLDGKIDFSRFIEPRKIELDPSVANLKRFIFKLMKNYFKKFNYTLETW